MRDKLNFCPRRHGETQRWDHHTVERPDSDREAGQSCKKKCCEGLEANTTLNYTQSVVAAAKGGVSENWLVKDQNNLDWFEKLVGFLLTPQLFATLVWEAHTNVTKLKHLKCLNQEK